MNRPTLPAPVDGYFDIPMPEDEEPITSDFGRLEAPCRVVTMAEQHCMAMKAASKYAWDCVKRDIERTHAEELRWRGWK